MCKRILVSAGVVAFGLMVAASVTASAQFQPNHSKRVMGYQDEDGVFHPFSRVVPDAATSQTFTGTIEVTFNITVKSTFPSGTKIYCGATADVVSESASAPSAPIVIGEEGAAAGTTTACTVNIPYSWTIYPSGVTVINEWSGGYTVGAINSSLPVVTGETVGLRVVTGTYAASTKVPASGTNSKFTIAVTL